MSSCVPAPSGKVTEVPATEMNFAVVFRCTLASSGRAFIRKSHKHEFGLGNKKHK